jgi:hypothetical protein
VNELVEYAQSIIAFLQQNGATLNLESQQALGSLLQNILQVIQEQQPAGAPPQPEAPPQGPSGPHGPGLTEAMPSSNIEGFAYDDKTGNLLVRFLGKHPNRNGPIYSYGGVPQNIFDIFRKGAIPAKTNGRNKWGEWFKGKYPSMGAAMHHVIKAGGYPYRRVA